MVCSLCILIELKVRYLQDDYETIFVLHEEILFFITFCEAITATKKECYY